MSFELPEVSCDTLLATFDRHARAIAASATEVAAVPGCAPWTTLDLLEHLGGVYAKVEETVASRTSRPLPPGPLAEPPPRAGSPPEQLGRLLDWFEARRGGVFSVLAACDPESPVWTWGPPSTNRFYIRRMAHETAVHRMDLADLAGAIPHEPDRDVVLDGIEEYFTVILPGSMRRLGRSAPVGSLHLHCTDGPGEWLVSVASDGVIDVRHEHAKGDTAWRGSSRDLFAAVWGRLVPGIEILGDQNVAGQWSAVAP